MKYMYIILFLDNFQGGSKHSVTPEAVDSMDDDAWGADNVNLLW